MNIRPLRRTALLIVLLASSARAENWPQWRGPFHNGSTTETGLPATWSKTENVAWVAPLPGPGSATPIVWGDRVFISSVDAKTNGLLALCLDATDGKILWRRETGQNIRFSRDNTAATPSPVTDGKTVWFHYGTGGVFAFDLEGKLLWSRDLVKDHGPLPFMFGYSSSPLLHQGKLMFVCLRNKVPNRYGGGPGGKPVESHVLALDPATGRDLWKQDRPTDARDEAQEAYSSAIPHEHDGRAEILVFGGDYLTAHDPETGKELWRWAGYNPRKIHHWRIIPSALVGDGLIYVVGPKYSTFFAIRPGRSKPIGQEHVAWTFEHAIPDAAMPVLYQDRLYLLQDNTRVMTCLDPKTGTKKWQERIGGKAVIRASITGADGKLYVINESGEVMVVAAGDTFQLLAHIDMGDDGPGKSHPVRSSIAAAGGKLFIRTTEKLYAIAKR